MVRRRLRARVLVAAVVVAVVACGRENEMAETVQMPDSMPLMRALENPAARDSMLDTMPGGEMARGDSSAASRLLRAKMRETDPAKIPP